MWFASDEEEDRFAHALLFSLLVHVLVLGYVKGVEPLRRAGGGGVLTVTLPGPAVERPAAAIRQPEAPVAIQVPATPRPATPLPQPRPRVAAVPPPASAPPRADGTPGGGGAGATARRGYGVVDVVMIVGGDGHPQTLIWDRLPALTQPQFDELERLLRRQAYPSSAGARIVQEIDVFDLLGIGRRSDANAGAQGGGTQ
jgi:hypothetical protein